MKRAPAEPATSRASVALSRGDEVIAHRAADGALTETGATGDPIAAEVALGAARGSAQMLSFDLAAEADSPGRLRVVVQAFGNGVTEVANFDASVADGDRIALDLGTLPAEHDKLRLVIRRAGWQQGALTVSDLALVPPAPTRSAQTEMP